MIIESIASSYLLLIVKLKFKKSYYKVYTRINITKLRNHKYFFTDLIILLIQNVDTSQISKHKCKGKGSILIINLFYFIGSLYKNTQSETSPTKSVSPKLHLYLTTS